ncbi:MAG: hypothetical protein ACK53L_34795, partial [Pirellulaceae bacterium]
YLILRQLRSRVRSRTGTVGVAACWVVGGGWGGGWWGVSGACRGVPSKERGTRRQGVPRTPGLVRDRAWRVNAESRGPRDGIRG